jgi:hypothetical protein
VLPASLLVLAVLGGYAMSCAVRPFRRGRLRVGRRALNAWRRTHDRGTR